MKSISLKRDILFFIITLLGILYSGILFFILFSFLRDTFVYFMTVQNLEEFVIYFYEVCTSPQYFWRIGLTLVTFFLSLRYAKALCRMIASIVKTHIFITGLRGERRGDIFIFDSQESHVFTSGFLMPQVFISKTLFVSLDLHEQQSILFHERGHVESFDPLKKMIVEFVFSTLPFFPMKTKIRALFSIITEVSADIYAMNKMDSKKNFLQALVNVFHIHTGPQIVSLPFAYQNIDRIRFHTKQQKFPFMLCCFSVLFVMGTISFIGQTTTQYSFTPQCASVCERIKIIPIREFF
ncbi:hypothetical protein COB57_05325 [Candidatus Peregrinibacteria bacterium]|nr:MAG: hypothetical protein COB57_05325 [Candidatus Peregrinibacteria bacterium]